MTHTCEKCLRVFVRKHNYNKHKEICLFNINSENDIKSDIESNINIPEYKDLYNFVLNLSIKISKLEKENESLKNIITNKLLKIKPVNWLNENMQCNINFKEWYYNFDVTEHLYIIFGSDLITGIITIIETYYRKNNNPPLFSFDNKNKQLFIYNDLEWHQLSQIEFDAFIENIANKFIVAWTKYLTQNDYLITDAKYIDQFNSFQTKVYGSSNNNDNRNSKIKQILYNKIKSTVSNVQIC